MWLARSYQNMGPKIQFLGYTTFNLLTHGTNYKYRVVLLGLQRIRKKIYKLGFILHKLFLCCAFGITRVCRCEEWIQFKLEKDEKLKTDKNKKRLWGKIIYLFIDSSFV